MTPWDAYRDPGLRGFYTTNYLARQSGITLYGAKKEMTSFGNQLPTLNQQLNTKAMREAQGLHAFNLGKQSLFEIYDLSRHKGGRLRELIEDYYQFLLLREALGLIAFDVPDSAIIHDEIKALSAVDRKFMNGNGKLTYAANPVLAKRIRPFVTGAGKDIPKAVHAAKLLYGDLLDMTDEEWTAAIEPLAADAGVNPEGGGRPSRIELTMPDGAVETLKPLEALRRVVETLGPENVFNTGVMATPEYKAVLTPIYPDQKPVYERIGQTRYWLYNKAGTRNYELIQKILAHFGDVPHPTVRKV